MAQGTKEFPLQINDRLQITIKGTDEEVPTTYLSRVENMSDGEIIIGWPTSRGIRAPVRESGVLSMSFISGASIYSMESRILQRVQDPIPLLVVRSEGPILKIQRRDYVRVPAIVDVHLAARVVTLFLDFDGKADATFITTHTVNISGAGFGIHHTAPPQLGHLYDVRLKIPSLEKPLVLTAKVVRCEPLGDPEKGRYYDVGFTFIQIKESIRRQIVSYVFRFQQKSLVQE